MTLALQIRNVPEEVRDALVEQASARGQSLQAFLLDLVRAQARRSANTAVLQRFRDRVDGSSVLPGDTAAMVAEEHGGR
ncbi:hypothetical protein [Cryptosporangium sp. NPDC048952]|uniref:FitA-like ribbon-helix-helix domain-containing protein n=1 Tax=Cryptosporangium sp. NPDC048952 TaxID=3363961 RepID=UPI0037142F29